MAVVTKKCYYSNTSKIILFDFYSRAPLHYWRENDGFPRFLTNAFAGTSLCQLFMALYKTKIMNENEIIKAYYVHHTK